MPEPAKTCPLCGTTMIKRPRIRPDETGPTGQEWVFHTCGVKERADKE